MQRNSAIAPEATPRFWLRVLKKSEPNVSVRRDLAGTNEKTRPRQGVGAIG